MNPLIESIAWLIGFLIVFVYSHNFFNDKRYYLEEPDNDKGESIIPQGLAMPVYPRYLIDRWKYRLWFFTFCISNFALYLILAVALQHNKAPLDQSALGAIQQLVYTAYPQLLSALFISGLLPNLPERLDIQKWFRDYAQERASIPEVARSYYNNIISKGLRISEDRIRRTVEYHSEDIVKVSDFDFPKHSPEKNWAYICYLHYLIEAYTENANSVYSRNINKEDLAYENFKRNFKRASRDITKNEKRDFSAPVSLCINRLFSQVTQIIVCLIFCSEPNDEEARSRFKELGMNLAVETVYIIRFDLLFPLSVIIFLAVFVLPFFIAGVLNQYGAPLPKNLTGLWLYRSALSAVLLIYLPILLTHIVKYWSIAKWPVRHAFDRLKPGPPCGMFIIGVLIGVVSFYLLDFIFSDMFESGVERRLCFASISGLTAAIAALHIDQKPRVWHLYSALLRSLGWSAATGLCFACACMISLFWSKNLYMADLFSLSFLQENLFIISLGASAGFVTGMVISLASEYARRIKNPSKVVDMNLSHYLVPKVISREKEISEMELNRIVRSETNLPDRFIRYLVQLEILDTNMHFTSYGVEQVKRLASA